MHFINLLVLNSKHTDEFTKYKNFKIAEEDTLVWIDI